MNPQPPYHTLTAQDLHALVRERVHELEVQHYGVALRLAEAADAAEKRRCAESLVDIQRRIEVHTGPAEPDGEPDGEQDAPPDDLTDSPDNPTQGESAGDERVNGAAVHA